MNNKEDSFSEYLKIESFFLLIKPEDNIYSNTSIRNSFFEELENLVKLGLKNIEISWSNNENWFDFVYLNCNIIKIYPIKSKDSSINILNYKNIDFIAAGGLSINDLKTYKSLGYKAVVIGDKAIKNKKFDPKIYEWLKNN